jgi:hypothetical protein
MSVPHILLLTAFPPGGVGIGGLFLSSLCKVYPRDSICCFSIALPKVSDVAPDMAWLPMKIHRMPRQNGIRRLGAFIEKLTEAIVQYYIQFVVLPKLIDNAVEFALAHNVNMVWAVLDHPVIIAIANEVTARLKARQITMVWDPPELLMENFGYHAFLRGSIMRKFAQALANSECCAVASDGMQEYYHQRYHTARSVVMIYTPLSQTPNAHPPHLKSQEQFVIGYAGSLYALDEWNALLIALNSINWQLEGREISIRVLSNNVALRARTKMNVEYLGWRSTDETMKQLAECDIAYLPYWFAPEKRLAVKLCFPNKLATYLSAGLPILFHGPADSSPAHLLKRFPAGISCSFIETETIIESVRKFIVDPSFYESAVEAADNAVKNYLHPMIFYQHFADMLSIDVTQLAIHNILL